MIKLALVGKNISHSRSPEIYKKHLLAEHSYTFLDYQSCDRIPSANDLLDEFTGISITSPYKTHFLNQVELTDETQKLGAVNCLYKANNKIFGANTDYEALKQLLPSHYLDRVAVLGTGAMSNIWQILLKEQSISYELFGRKINGDLNLLDLSSYTLIINCCSREFDFLGKLTERTLFWDMNYSKKHSGTISNYQDGMELLDLQAQLALKHWGLV